MLFEEVAKRYMGDKRKRLRACTLGGATRARSGATCTLTCGVSQSTADYWQVDKRIPEELRPAGNIYMPEGVTNSDGYVLNACAYCFIGQGGTVGFKVASEVPGAMNRGTCSWDID